MRYSASYADLCLKMREHLCFHCCKFLNLSIISIAVLENVSPTQSYRKEPPLIPFSFTRLIVGPARPGHLRCRQRRKPLSHPLRLSSYHSNRRYSFHPNRAVGSSESLCCSTFGIEWQLICSRSSGIWGFSDEIGWAELQESGKPDVTQMRDH
jgi:hypothetical protein